MQLETTLLPIDENANLDIAATAIKKGELVAFPTDTVYGLGADPFNPEAVQKLYAVKKRPSSKAIPILLGEESDLTNVAGPLSDVVFRLMERFWPGALTLIVPRHPDLPVDLSGLNTVGVRLPDLASVRALLLKTGPLAVTSANRSGVVEPCTAEAVRDQLAGRIAWILDGGSTPGGSPSTVIDVTGGEPVVLREGPITKKQLARALRSSN
ncbi:MAG: threonylcarbamoyl-AMP synthase [Anaerolineales bacterium]|nr:threonylcarbamoyl-AMP synthase [Anaerolineales bacterium]